MVKMQKKHIMHVHVHTGHPHGWTHLKNGPKIMNLLEKWAYAVFPMKNYCLHHSDIPHFSFPLDKLL